MTWFQIFWSYLLHIHDSLQNHEGLAVFMCCFLAHMVLVGSFCKLIYEMKPIGGHSWNKCEACFLVQYLGTLVLTSCLFGLGFKFIQS